MKEVIAENQEKERIKELNIFGIYMCLLLSVLAIIIGMLLCHTNT